MSLTTQRPEILAVREAEGRRQHADDRVRLAVDQHARAQDAGGAAEAAVPEAIGDDHHAIAPWLVLAGEEVAAGPWPHSEHGEQIGGGVGEVDHLRRLPHAERRAARHEGRHRLAGAGVGAPEPEVLEVHRHGRIHRA
jgi:hypothetical protein